jgi:hypothetical protein
VGFGDRRDGGDRPPRRWLGGHRRLLAGAFWLNIPVGLLVVIGIVKALPETRDANATDLRDWGGVLLSALGMGALVFALIEAEWYGWWRQDDGALSPVPFVLVVGLVLLVGFVWLERARARAGRDVLVDLGLFGIRSFRNGAIAALIVSFGEFGLLFTLPLLLQGTLGYSALSTGAVILVLAVGTFLASGALPQLSQRMSQREIVRIGLFLEALAVEGSRGRCRSTSRPGRLRRGCSCTASAWASRPRNSPRCCWPTSPSTRADRPPGSSRACDRSALPSASRSSAGFLIAQLGRATQENLASLGLPTAASDRIVTAVRESAGIAIAGFQSDPAQAAIARAASEAMIEASRWTTGLAALALAIGLLATIALPRNAGSDRESAPDVGP